MTLLRRCAILLLAIGAISPAARAEDRKDKGQQKETELASSVAAQVQPYIDNKIVMGIAVGIVKGDDVHYYGFGKFSEKDPRKPDEHTLFEIGSITKTFTGTLLGEAVAREEVRLDQPLQELLPEDVKLTEKLRDALQLKHLATHTSSLPRLPSNMPYGDPENPYADYTEQRLWNFLKTYEPKDAPGTKMEYSNLGAGLLGHVLAKHANTDYASLLADRLTKPLEMNETAITLSAEQQQRLAPPHNVDGAPAKNWDLAVLAGAGAIRSTTSDMVKYVKAYLKPPASPLGKGIELAWRKQQDPISKDDFALGLAWHLARDGATRWHSGQTGGYHADVFIIRGVNIGVVVLGNTATGETSRLAEDLTKMLFGLKVPPRSFAKDAAVPADKMDRLVGKYMLNPFVYFTVTKEEDRLMVALTGQPALRVFPKSETEWYYKAVEASLTFKVNDAGECTELELFQNGVRQKAVKLKLKP